MERIEQQGLPMTFGLRPAEPGDRAVIATTWGRTHRPRAGIAKAVYTRHHPHLVDACLRDGRAVVLCSPDVPATVFGWALGEGELLHYVYIVPELQHRGLARVLVASALGGYGARIEVTHRWPWPSARYVFNPFPLMRAA